MTDHQTILRKLRPEQDKTLNDQAFAALFGKLFSGGLRFNRSTGEWMHYDGKCWRRDQQGLMAERAAKQFERELLTYCGTIYDDEIRGRFVRRVGNYSRYPARVTLLKDARETMFADQNHFNADKALFNVLNGTINLETFEFRPHDSKDMLSKIAGAAFDPNADPEPFERFIGQIMEGNTEKAKYLQRFYGYSLSGNPEQECLLLEFGPSTRNGKGTLNSTVLLMFGDYGVAVQPETLQERKRDSRQASGDIARLADVRFVSISEPSKEMRIDSALLKQLTGRDPVTARFLHQGEFTFTPTFSAAMNTNFLPYIADSTVFDSDRLQVIEFDHHFSEKERDPHLKDRLSKPENLSAVLNWCLEGLREYRRQGLNPPRCVQEATERYRLTADEIGHYIADCLTQSATNCKGRDVYEDYRGWCRDNGHVASQKQRFFRACKERGILAETGTVSGRTEHNVIIGYQIVQ